MAVKLKINECFEHFNAGKDKIITGDKVAYIYSACYVKCCDRMPKIKSRASTTHALIEAYKLHEHMDIIKPELATVDELATFHSKQYIDFLQDVNDSIDLEKREDDALEYGFGYDNPLIQKLFDYVGMVAGGSLAAAQCLISDTHTIAINWPGGWHHGTRDEAAGFCYVNDIVLAILKLRLKYDKVLYVDLDLHHGDGVEDAFSRTSKVMTVSFHKYEPGFFPGTGSITDIGLGKALYYSVNVPLQDGIQDAQYFHVFKCVMMAVKDCFPANAIVCQCGADGLSGDPMSSFNLTPKGLGLCIQELLSWQLPILFLGGGGYNIPNTARCWTYLTSIIANFPISSDIPDNKYLMLYGPGYDLEVLSGNRPNYNTDSDIQNILNTIEGNLKRIK